jgi:sodium-coupled neutral amino acid transporter 11
MLIMTFGAMIAYLLVVKDTIPSVLGIDQQDEFQKRVVLFICALTIMLPLSLQRDMADLAKTSAISVFFNFCMIFIIAICSPVKESIDQVGGVEQMLKHSIVKPDTLFVGLGVFSFAFVCQDSSFIIAGSLSQPTRKRWGIVTRSSLLTCAILATFLGLAGYVGFQGATEGNILNNFDNISPDEIVLGIIPMKVAIDVARALIGLAMFSVYPLASYVGRHVLIVLLFSGRQAHEGDDHTVLARDDRRIILTLVLFVAAIVPAILYNDTGVVLSITGALAGSCLSYLGPGAAYLAVHGQEFLALANWNVSPATRQVMWKYPIPDERKEMRGENYGSGFFGDFYRLVAWWVLLMPIWCVLASTGVKHLEKFEEERLRKSPAVQQRLGMVRHRPAPEPVSSNRDAATGLPGGPSRFEIFKKKSISFDERIIRNRAVDDNMTETHRLLEQRQILLPPSSVGKAVGSKETDLDETVELVRASEGCTSVSYSRDHQGEDDHFVENDPQGDVPTVFDFVVSISYMIFGSIALSAGLWSISNT